MKMDFEVLIDEHNREREERLVPEICQHDDRKNFSG
jgi:hypothetical protein